MIPMGIQLPPVLILGPSISSIVGGGIRLVCARARGVCVSIMVVIRIRKAPPRQSFGIHMTGLPLPLLACLLACFIDSFMVSLCSVSSLPSLSSPGSVQFSCFITPHLTSLLYFYLYISISIYENRNIEMVVDGRATEPLHVSTSYQIITFSAVSVLRVGKPINNINNASISAIKITHLI